MFLIAGIQPKTTRLDQAPRPCHRCGSSQAVTQRIDHYFSLFFIPLIKVKTGQPFVFCPRCQANSAQRTPPPGTGDSPPAAASLAMACPACGGNVDAAHRYCPHCGQRVRAG